jgi:DNA polymerase III subunit epsilon
MPDLIIEMVDIVRLARIGWTSLIQRSMYGGRYAMEISIKLSRPLAIIDLETTGLDIGIDRIVEIAILKVHPDGTGSRYYTRVNPQMTIPAEATAVHGISDKDAKDKPTFEQISPGVASFLDGCDLAGFNILGFDLRMLQCEFARAGSEFSLLGRAIVDAKQIFHTKEPRDLEAACRFYLNEEQQEAHSAWEDVRTTWRVLNAQLSRYEDLPRDPAGLDAMYSNRDRFVDLDRKFAWKGRHATFAFGKYRGRLLEDIAEKDRDYLMWMAGEGEFSSEIKRMVRDALSGIFPKRTKQMATSV